MTDVRVRVAAPREAVWRALSEPGEIRRWFGWDADGLAEEIRQIFVDGAAPHPPDRIALGAGHAIELADDGGRTAVRAVVPGAAGADAYDDIREGWRSFLQQLRHHLERHPGEERRTLFLDGTASPPAALHALQERLGGREWHSARFGHGIATDDLGGALAVLQARGALDCQGPVRVTVTLTTHGLDDAAFAAVREEWEAWWALLTSG